MPHEQMAFDIAVIGAGIAGASISCELASDASVVLLEREDRPGYHTSGRSAALYATINGNPLVRALSIASGPFYREPPPGFCEHPLLSPRGLLMIARADQRAALDAVYANAGGPGRLQMLDAQALRGHNPLLREAYAAAAIWDESAADIDVHAMLQGCLKLFRTRGGALRTGAGAGNLRRANGAWKVSTRQGEVSARIVVNAAGAWADEVAVNAGLPPLGLTPLRRTALVTGAPENAHAMTPPLRDWPMTIDVDEEFYLKPEAGALLLSPAEETPMPPQDIQPDEIDVAICIDRIERAFDMRVRQITRKWAGLRTFAPDRSPVAGYDPKGENFFWLAGQGGYGFQTAPALAQAAAALVRGNNLPAALSDAGVMATQLSPARFR
ncbi:MAG: NAD(P)/FAD-dependent oxidoreductase [Beijerinckiaceae bacterium]